MDAPLEIDCIDCGGTAHLISFLPPDDPAPTNLAYRCADCAERFDVVWEPGDDGET